jgi:two-component system OmpR family sensor kinase
LGRLFWKFFFVFSAALLVVAVAVGATVWLLRPPQELRFSNLAGGPQADLVLDVAATVLETGGPEVLRELLRGIQEQRRRQVYVVDDQGLELLGRRVPAVPLEQATSAAQQGQQRVAREVMSGGRKYLLFVPRDQPLLRPPPPLRGLSPPVLIAFGILASLVCSALLAWYLAKPIGNLRWALAGISAGKLDTRVAPRMGRRRDEIADLGRDFDHMAQQLQNLVGAQRRLLHDVSHELRSPLARLQAAVGLARQQPEKLDDWLTRIEREGTRLDALVGELLTLSRLEAGIGTQQDDYVDLHDLVSEVSDDARFEAAASGRRVAFAGSGEIIIRARAELLRRAVENVIRNAVKYAPAGTAVDVELDRADQSRHARLIVSDRGPGIPESDLTAVFEPFFRSAGADSRSGYGLGLAIARRAVEAHGGSIRAINREGGGLRVEIELPAGVLEAA